MTVRQARDRVDRTIPEAGFEARADAARDESLHDHHSIRTLHVATINLKQARVTMRKEAEYAVARRDGSIAVSRDEAENLLERRGAAGQDNPKHHRPAANKPRRGLRQRAAKAGRRVRGMLSRAWHWLFLARGTRDGSDAP